MLTKRIKTLFRDLKSDTNGNAMILMAMGMPVLMGASGFAVDMTQWYMWKRELQFAVDQAAIAGAWASADAATASSYSTRASQEFNANLSQLSGLSITPVVGKADYDTGTQNSVTVSASVARSLPFSKILGQQSTTIAASSQATFEAATNWTACMLALDPSSDDAFILGGSASGTVNCGMGTISSSSYAFTENGNPNAKVNQIISGGGIESTLSDNLLTGGTLNANVSGLSDPYESLTPPASPATQTFSCPSGTSTTTTGSSTTADVTTTTTLTYTYWQGKTNGTLTEVAYTGTGAKTNSTTTATSTGESVPNGTVENSTVVTKDETAFTGNKWNATGGEKVFEKLTEYISKTYKNVVGTGGTASSGANNTSMQPGTYTNISITCDTHFAPGVYIITGTFDLGQNKKVTGDDVMFVLQGSGTEKFKLNSKSEVVMSGITKSTLINTYGLSEADASLMAGMLIYDPNSTADVQINGGADMQLEGVVYMPKRKAKFNGNSSVTGHCMMIAAGKLEFTGSNQLSSFCVPSGVQAIDIGGTTVKVRLVA